MSVVATGPGSQRKQESGRGTRRKRSVGKQAGYDRRAFPSTVTRMTAGPRRKEKQACCNPIPCWGVLRGLQTAWDGSVGQGKRSESRRFKRATQLSPGE